MARLTGTVRTAWLLGMVSLCALLPASLGAIPSYALFDRSPKTAPAWYSHAWYLGVDTAGYYYNLGKADGQFDMQFVCNSGYAKDVLAILDFGGPAANLGGAYGGYGTYWPGKQPIPGNAEPDSNIVGATESYALGWYNVTTSCPRLNLAIGTNNSTPCAQDSTCSGSAGANWAHVVQDVNGWLSSQNYAWQIQAVAADDVEPGYSTYPPAFSFLSSYTAVNSSQAFIKPGSTLCS